jgi:hypothetical protein
MQFVLTLDEPTRELFKQLIAAVQGIEKNTAPSRFAVAFTIALVNKENTMKAGKLFKLVKGRAGASAPISISDSAPQAIAVFGQDAEGEYGALLPAGASIALSVGPGANGTPGTLLQDATPGIFTFTDAAGVVHTNVQALGSAVFTPTPAPNADVNDPFSFNYQITGGDGDSGSLLLQTAVGADVSEVIALPTGS